MMRVAMIGTGGISRVHLDYLRGRDDVEIAALCDVDEGHLAEKQKSYGGKGFNDFNAMLDEITPDAVWLCTPPDVRREPLLACADRGVPVLCEKPVGRTAEKAESLAGELKERSARVQVGYCFRSMPSVKRLKEELQKDRVHAFQSLYLCGVGLGTALRTWYFQKELSGGFLIDQATHNLDLLRFFFGEVESIAGLAANPVKAKQPGYTIEETYAISMIFEKGLTGTHTHSIVGDGWRNEIVISGEEAFYRINLNHGIVTVERGAETWNYRQERRGIHDWQNITFLDMVASGDWSRNPSPFDDAARSLKLLLDCDQSLPAPAK